MESVALIQPPPSPPTHTHTQSKQPPFNVGQKLTFFGLQHYKQPPSLLLLNKTKLSQFSPKISRKNLRRSFTRIALKPEFHKTIKTLPAPLPTPKLANFEIVGRGVCVCLCVCVGGGRGVGVKGTVYFVLLCQADPHPTTQPLQPKPILFCSTTKLK